MFLLRKLKPLTIFGLQINQSQRFYFAKVAQYKEHGLHYYEDRKQKPSRSLIYNYYHKRHEIDIEKNNDLIQSMKKIKPGKIDIETQIQLKNTVIDEYIVKVPQHPDLLTSILDVIHLTLKLCKDLDLNFNVEISKLLRKYMNICGENLEGGQIQLIIDSISTYDNFDRDCFVFLFESQLNDFSVTNFSCKVKILKMAIQNFIEIEKMQFLVENIAEEIVSMKGVGQKRAFKQFFGVFSPVLEQFGDDKFKIYIKFEKLLKKKKMVKKQINFQMDLSEFLKNLGENFEDLRKKENFDVFKEKTWQYYQFNVQTLQEQDQIIQQELTFQIKEDFDLENIVLICKGINYLMKNREEISFQKDIEILQEEIFQASRYYLQKIIDSPNLNLQNFQELCDLLRFSADHKIDLKGVFKKRIRILDFQGVETIIEGETIIYNQITLYNVKELISEQFLGYKDIQMVFLELLGKKMNRIIFNDDGYGNKLDNYNNKRDLSLQESHRLSQIFEHISEQYKQSRNYNKNPKFTMGIMFLLRAIEKTLQIEILQNYQSLEQEKNNPFLGGKGLLEMDAKKKEIIYVIKEDISQEKYEFLGDIFENLTYVHPRSKRIFNIVDIFFRKNLNFLKNEQFAQFCYFFAHFDRNSAQNEFVIEQRILGKNKENFTADQLAKIMWFQVVRFGIKKEVWKILKSDFALKQYEISERYLWILYFTQHCLTLEQPEIQFEVDQILLGKGEEQFEIKYQVPETKFIKAIDSFFTKFFFLIKNDQRASIFPIKFLAENAVDVFLVIEMEHQVITYKQELGWIGVMRRMLQKSGYRIRVFEFIEWEKNEKLGPKQKYLQSKCKKVEQDYEAAKRQFVYNY